MQQPNLYLYYLIAPSLQEVNRLFLLSFEDNDHRPSYKRYFLTTAEIKYDKLMIDGQRFFDQPVNNNLRTFDNIRKIATGQGDDYATGCLLDYNYSNTANQFYRNLARNPNAYTTMFFISEGAKETI